jgi:uncharacterized protein DUF5677
MFSTAQRIAGVLETVATLQYLLEDDEQGGRFDQYIMDSLIVERELLKEIQSNVSKRDGHVLAIEERMRRSIQSTAATAGVTDVAGLPGRAKVGFPKAEARVKLLRPRAYVAYRSGSSETHGDWSDLFRNHLNYDGTAFSPDPHGSHVRPQTSLTPVTLATVFVTQHAIALLGPEARQYLVPRFKELGGRADRVTDLHEALLSRWASKGAP